MGTPFHTNAPRIIDRILVACIALLFCGVAIYIATPNTTTDTSNGISVSWIGVAQVQPDTLTLYFSIQEKAESTQEAQNTIDHISTSFITLVKELGMPDKSIQTSNYSVFPSYYWDRDTSRQIANGFEASQNITITLNGEGFIELGQKILSAAPSVGNIAINGSNFSLRDKFAGESEVRTLALEQARKKAEQLAEAAGVGLGDPISIIENSNGAVFFPMYNVKSNALMEEVAVDWAVLEAGSSEVTVNVNVVYAIK